jgi:holo-[acyl-carrier protein] synthase
VIHGIGTDIVRIARIENLLARWGQRFARRVLGPDELREFERRYQRGEHGPSYAARYLAKRFAAKEAFSKALGLGLRPVAVARNALASYLEERGLHAHISLSDEVDSAVAFAVLESSEERS